ncbi:MAG: hypothetical protein KIT84_33435 [Labilithrix sp.]|nr:hypothetical protein [Labilithrix sp.]MCW5815951.1 hypothetical protein [Labilithrix sp.]
MVRAGQLSRLVFAASAGVLVIAPACLGSLPEPLVCPAEARFASVTACPLQPAPSATSSPPLPSPEGGALPSPSQCSLAIPCLQTQGRTCACTEAEECAGASQCTPPPECPPSVLERVRGATCYEVTTSLPIGPLTCACGCGSCAAACDGYGPVIGARATLSVALPALPGTGRLGFMIRARGTSTLTASFGGAQAPSNPPSADVTPSAEFTDVALLPGLVLNGRAPTNMLLTATGQVEVDCIVPFYVP